MSLSRRELIKAASIATVPTVSGSADSETPSPTKPNIVVIIADQVRWDAVGAYGVNPMDLTPNIDAMARDGVLYRNMFTNQPVCSPSRACMFTGQYPARHGVWRNTGNGVALSPNATTLASECRKAGYSANYIGKWHLAEGTRGPVPPPARGGFLDLWEASNELEWTTHPYEGDLYDGDARPIHFQDEYRVDFIMGRTKRFLQSVSKTSPFLLVVSLLEPHQQNDLGRMVAPKGYSERYKNPFVPADLKYFPGNWQEQLPDYYGSLKRVDESVGEIRAALAQADLASNTIVVFVSDHGCHFMTRNTEYKRSGHDASIHIPLVIEGPGFSGHREVLELVSMVDLMPTLLSAADIPVPATVQGKSTLALATGTRSEWRNEVFIQMAEFWVARALRTPEWTYVVSAPWVDGKHTAKPNASEYFAFQLYNNLSDPHQLVNLAGHKETLNVEEHLRERLRVRMQESGDSNSQLFPCEFPYT